MILGYKTAAESRVAAQIQSALVNNPQAYYKVLQALDRLAEYQFFNPTHQQIAGQFSFKIPAIGAAKITEVLGFELTTEPTTPPDNDPFGLQWVNITGASWTGQIIGETQRTILQADVVNSELVANTLKTVFSFPVRSGKSYKFHAFIPYTAALITTGSRWTIDGPGATMAYRSSYPLTATTFTSNFASAYNIPALCNASSLLINTAVIEGMLTANANGNVDIRFASEVSNSAITAKAGAVLEYTRVL